MGTGSILIILCILLALVSVRNWMVARRKAALYRLEAIPNLLRAEYERGEVVDKLVSANLIVRNGDNRPVTKASVEFLTEDEVPVLSKFLGDLAPGETVFVKQFQGRNGIWWAKFRYTDSDGRVHEYAHRSLHSHFDSLHIEKIVEEGNIKYRTWRYGQAQEEIWDPRTGISEFRLHKD